MFCSLFQLTIEEYELRQSTVDLGKLKFYQPANFWLNTNSKTEHMYQP